MEAYGRSIATIDRSPWFKPTLILKFGRAWSSAPGSIRVGWSIPTVTLLHLEGVDSAFGVGVHWGMIQGLILLMSNRQHGCPRWETYLNSCEHLGTFEGPTNAYIYDPIPNELPVSKYRTKLRVGGLHVATMDWTYVPVYRPEKIENDHTAGVLRARPRTDHSSIRFRWRKTEIIHRGCAQEGTQLSGLQRHLLRPRKCQE